jgi:hypothetical protein
MGWRDWRSVRDQLAIFLISSVCEGQQFSTTQKATGVRTILGAGGGAIIGSAVGHPVAATLIGAGVGGVGGYAVGRGLQNNEKAQQRTRAEFRRNSAKSKISARRSSNFRRNRTPSRQVVPHHPTRGSKCWQPRSLISMGGEEDGRCIKQAREVDDLFVLKAIQDFTAEPNCS